LVEGTPHAFAGIFVVDGTCWLWLTAS